MAVYYLEIPVVGGTQAERAFALSNYLILLTGDLMDQTYYVMKIKHVLYYTGSHWQERDRDREIDEKKFCSTATICIYRIRDLKCK